MFDSTTVTIEEAPSAADVHRFHEILRQHNRLAAGDPGFQGLTVLARDESGSVIGGLSGETYWGWLYVENLAVEKEYRGQGIGSRLLARAEAEAVRRGCHGIYLDTFSFQAREFYEERGYVVFGSLSEFPTSHSRYFLRKYLPST